MKRLVPSDYGDGNDLPRGVLYEDEGDGNIEIDEQDLTSARVISNLVHDQDSDGGNYLPSTRKLNQLFFQFGQFLIHDIGLTGPDFGHSGFAGNESFNIGVPHDDPDFSFSEIPFLRSVSVPAGDSTTGKREQLNRITAFIDGSAVYGSDEARTANLRTFWGGQLRTEFGPHGHLLPFNRFGEENANPTRLPEESLFLAGDVRANEQIGLIAIHTLFVREHNRLAGEIAQHEFHGADLGDPDVDLAIFQEARARVGAIIQAITYEEWLPILIGRNQLGDYQGYDPDVCPQLSNVFSTAAFRIGHTMLPPSFTLTERDGSVKVVSLREAFFNPDLVTEAGIDPIFRGFAKYLQQEIDRFVVDDVRNFLFPDPVGGFDLAAVNIQRGRDHGLPSYNALRWELGLRPAYRFGDVTPDRAAQKALGHAYGNQGVDALDIWTGGLCEPAVFPGALGETFTAIIADQFIKLRDGDRFFYRNRELYSYEFIDSIDGTTLADVILRNTYLGEDEINDHTFFLPGCRPFQPDLRISGNADPKRQRGDDIYNTTGSRQLSRSVTRGRQDKVFFSLENDGGYSDVVSMRVSGMSRGARLRPTVHEITGKAVNITSEIFSGQYRAEVSPGDLRKFRYQLQRLPSRHRRTTARSRIRANSLGDSGFADVNKSETRFR